MKKWFEKQNNTVKVLLYIVLGWFAWKTYKSIKNKIESEKRKKMYDAGTGVGTTGAPFNLQAGVEKLFRLFYGGSSEDENEIIVTLRNCPIQRFREFNAAYNSYILTQSVSWWYIHKPKNLHDDTMYFLNDDEYKEVEYLFNSL